MMKKLTKEQEHQIQVYLNKWLSIGLKTDEINKDKYFNAHIYLLNNIRKTKDKIKVTTYKKDKLLSDILDNINNYIYEKDLDIQF